MIRKLPSFIFAIITLSLQVIFIIILLIVSKLGSGIDGLVMALWTWPLFFMGILALVLGLIALRKSEDKKKSHSHGYYGRLGYLTFYNICVFARVLYWNRASTILLFDKRLLEEVVFFFFIIRKNHHFDIR